MRPATRVVLALAVTAPFALVGRPSQAHADACTPARAMIVLDRSSSMITGDIAGTPKWDIAVDALTSVSTTYENSVELGLMQFPNPDECAPGSVFVEPGLGRRDDIVAAV